LANEVKIPKTERRVIVSLSRFIPQSAFLALSSKEDILLQRDYFHHDGSMTPDNRVVQDTNVNLTSIVQHILGQILPSAALTLRTFLLDTSLHVLDLSVVLAQDQALKHCKQSTHPPSITTIHELVRPSSETTRLDRRTLLVDRPPQARVDVDAGRGSGSGGSGGYQRTEEEMAEESAGRVSSVSFCHGW
jgi:hypothetical protein